VWSAQQQFGVYNWENSGVTYTARLLVMGSQILRSATTIQLGFQGRSGGASYTVSKVSIAEKSSESSKGYVVDSTWTKVTQGRDSRAQQEKNPPKKGAF